MEELIGNARSIVNGYAEDMYAQNLDGIMSVLCDDISISVPNKPPIDGKESCKKFYEKSFDQGSWDFSLDISSTKFVSELIFLNGKMNKKFVPEDGGDNLSNYFFSFILKKSKGELKIWQCRVISE